MLRRSQESILIDQSWIGGRRRRPSAERRVRRSALDVAQQYNFDDTAEILVAAIAGSLFYGIVALIEKKVTFWHPSQRNQRG